MPRLIDDLGLPSARVHDAIGDWAGSVENAVLVQMPASGDMATLRFAAAWLGLMCRQQAVLLFCADPAGDDRLATFDVDAPIDHVRHQLDRHGIRERTIIARPGGCWVVVVDPGGGRQAQLGRAARSLCRADHPGGPLRIAGGADAGGGDAALSRRHVDLCVAARR